MAEEHIQITRARTHNLKDINTSIPRNKLTIITGVSGSGKSTLAFDTIYAEGQRRYVESLSTYARQFLGQMEKPDVESITGLSPAIAIEQRTTQKNPRSTVGTITEIYDYLRLLYARCGTAHCPECGTEVTRQSIDEITSTIYTHKTGTKIQIFAPFIRAKRGECKKELNTLRERGFLRLRINKEMHKLDESFSLKKSQKHTIDVLIDRVKIDPENRERITDSLETALKLSEGLVSIFYNTDPPQEQLYSEHLNCPRCNISIPKLEPQLFSFNSPYGACQLCHGIGELYEFDEALILPDHTLSIQDGAIAAIKNINSATWYYSQLESLAKHYQFSLTDKIQDLPPEILHTILHGTADKLQIRYRSRYRNRTKHEAFAGLIKIFTKKLQNADEDEQSHWQRFMTATQCPQCTGERLCKEARHVKIQGHNIITITKQSITENITNLQSITWTKKEKEIATSIRKEIITRLQFLEDVGLGYLSLARQARSLSGGEMQRIRLASQIGSQLLGVLYVLDEPTIGLHPRDNAKLIRTLTKLKDLGNTVIVVEHDEEMMHHADHILDLGPGAGVHGGEIIATGSAQELCQNKDSLTGQYLNRSLTIQINKKRRERNPHSIKITNCIKNNLKKITAEFPLSRFIVITGVSGSGKSTLINETLYPALTAKLSHKHKITTGYDQLSGHEHIDKVIHIDQSPIGRTPRSNPATYLGFFTNIRELYAQVPESKIRGYRAGRFSFNIKGGRCETCQGGGTVKIAMHFLPDIYLECTVCKGKRYNQETLNITYKKQTISDVLNMTAHEALSFFAAIPGVHRKIQALVEVGLGYIHLGQSANTLSGGEAQRVKLASELSKKSTGKTFYILDEPTTGLHFHDIQILLETLNALVEQGNTVVIIEHNLDVIAQADHIIDLGPEGGDQGGYILHTGSFEDLTKNKSSHTGYYCKHKAKQKKAKNTQKIHKENS